MARSNSGNTTDRRRFLADAGKYGALLVGSTYVAARSAGAQDAPPGGWDVRDKLDMLRIWSAVQRAPGVMRIEVRKKSNIATLQYAGGVLFEQLKVQDNRGPLMFIQNWINEAAFGEPGGPTCMPFVERDFVGEYFMATGDTDVINVQGELMPSLKEQAAEAAAAAAAAPQGGPPPRRRRPQLPEWCEQGTDLRVATRQVVAEGTRPLAEKGHEKGLYFMKLAPSVPRAGQVKLWQDLHQKALAASRVFASELAGFELTQRMPEAPDVLMQECGTEIPLPELVAAYWSKTPRGAAQFPVYVRALKAAADQQKAINGRASFFVMAEEEEVRQSSALVR